MSSYYNRVTGNILPNKLAKSEDINNIQTNIRKAIQELTTDFMGPHFIIGEDEEALKVVPTTNLVDQANYNYSSDDKKCWISFYDRYLRQSIYIDKSSIESITLHIRNTTNITTTIYAEIQDINFRTIQESSVKLEPTEIDDSDTLKYNTVTFNFNVDHLPVGHYYFVLRPVDISATDLAENGDESVVYDTITWENFLVRYDVDGSYHKDITETVTSVIETETETNETQQIVEHAKGLEASYDGSTYLDAYLLPEQQLSEEAFNELDVDDPNFDLYFEETFSSGLTYLVQPGRAIVAGEVVDSFDTHVKIDSPSDLGDRTDLIILTTEGELKVRKGKVTNGEKIYPTYDGALRLAYITVYRNGSKVALIEQDDENGMTRKRDVLERIRRLEKKLNYQVENNSPSRIKYNAEVDPVMFHNGVTASTWDTEGSYNLGISTNDNGDNVLIKDQTIEYIWSLTRSTYTYSYEKVEKTSAYCQVFNVDAPVNANSLPKNSQYDVSTGTYVCRIDEKKLTTSSSRKTALKKPVKGIDIKVQVKKGKTIKYSKTATTNKNGEAKIQLRNAKLDAGTYTVITTISGKEIKTTYKVHKKSYTVTSPGSKVKHMVVKDKVKTTVKDNLKNNGIIYGDDAFTLDGITLDNKNGIIELEKITTKNKYTKNTPLKNNKSTKPYYNSEVYSYKVYSNAKNLKSEFPVLHLSFDRDTHIKSIRPYIRKFKNIESFGIILFKNDQIVKIKNHKRKLVEKKIKKDPVFPTIFKGTKSLKKTKGKDGVKVLDSYVTFNTNIKLEAGTYSLAIFAKVESGKDEGILYLREFDTHGNLEKYGMSAKAIGSSNLSLLKMYTNHLTSRSWNVVFNQKPDTYTTHGVVTSTPKNSGEEIKSCTIRRNLKIPDGCSVKLEVSNNGGGSWVNITNVQNGKRITFSGTGNVFRWRLTFDGNGEYTPQLYYNPKKQYAIKFTLNTKANYTPYEDFTRCYETPLFNANSITQGLLRNQLIEDKFSEWEFARLFMLDEDESSTIDICISHDNDDYSTNIQTKKENWGKKIFFNQIFADLKLSDFNTSSVDYDNYEGSTEFDEHNFRFKVPTDLLTHNNSYINLATASPSNSDYFYGNINNDEITQKINQYFTYESKQSNYKTETVIEEVDTDEDTTHEEESDAQYQYAYQEDRERTIYGGSMLTEGPYELATLNTDYTSFDSIDDENKNSYIINGISFNKPLYLDESKSSIYLEVYPFKPVESDDKTVYTLPSGTLELVVSLSPDGTIYEDDKSNGIAYPINRTLTFNKFNTVDVDLSDNIDAYSQSGIRSIGIRINKDHNTEIVAGNGIGIGLLGGASYNRRPYVPYMYSGNWSRLKWEALNSQARMFNVIRGLNTTNGVTSAFRFFYPTYSTDDSQANVEITNLTSGECFDYGHKFSGTSINKKLTSKDGSTVYKYPIQKITRKENEISADIDIGDANHTIRTYSSKTDSNEILLEFPAGVTGNMFKIDTNIPLSIYDLIKVEYYVFSEREKTNKEEYRGITDMPVYALDTDPSNYEYKYYGNFSKGDIKIKLYASTDINNEKPVEELVLPAWGRIQQNATIRNKKVNAWFKKRSTSSHIKAIVVERDNPTEKDVEALKLIISNIMFYNAETMPALGPQMQMRVYPKEDDVNDVQIRKSGCIYRI